MARIRRVAVLVGAAALTGAFVTGPAQADLPEVFSGSAAGTALELSTLGRQATAGHSEAKANSAGPNTPAVATSKAQGLVLPEIGARSEVTADAAPGKTVSAGRTCQQPAQLSELAKILNLGLVCGSAEADNGPTPKASAEGSIAELDVSVSSVITKVEETVAQIEQTTNLVKVGDKLAGLLDVCANEPDTTDGAVCDTTTPLKTLVETVLKTEVIDVELGKSTSSVTTGPTAVTSEATAAGGTIKILPSPQVPSQVPSHPQVPALNSSEPLVTISIGDAKVKTVYDRGTGSATAEVDPAVVRIKLNSGLVRDGVTIPDVTVTPDPKDPTKTTVTRGGKTIPLQDEFVVGPDFLLDLAADLDTIDGSEELIRLCDPEIGDSVCILPGTPFETRVWFAGARKTVNADGSAEAEAHAVRVDLLVGTIDSLDLPDETSKELAKIVSDPAVHLALAHAKAVVGGRRAQTTSTTRTTDGGCTPGTTNCPDDKQEQARSGAPGNGEPPLELPRTGGLPFVPMLGSAGLALAVVLRRAMAQASR